MTGSSHLQVGRSRVQRVLLGLACAVGLALLLRGGVLHFVAVLLAWGALSVIGIGMILSTLLRRRWPPPHMPAVFLSLVVVVVSFPVGMVVDQWDVWRAKRWCERTVALPPAERAKQSDSWHPALVLYEGSAECTVLDRDALMPRGWTYTADRGWQHFD